MSEYNPNEVITYPVDASTVDIKLLEIEEEYEKDVDRRLMEGEINPRFIRWYNEDNNNPEPTDATTAKLRYRTCKLCPYFDPEKLLCDDCKCYVPMKAQFVNSTCPQNKWPS